MNNKESYWCGQLIIIFERDRKFFCEIDFTKKNIEEKKCLKIYQDMLIIDFNTNNNSVNMFTDIITMYMDSNDWWDLFVIISVFGPNHFPPLQLCFWGQIILAIRENHFTSSIRNYRQTLLSTLDIYFFVKSQRS